MTTKTDSARNAARARARQQVADALPKDTKFPLTQVRLRAGLSQADFENLLNTHQPAASAEPFAVLAVEKNGSVSVFADSTALSERPIDDGDRQWAASRQAQLVEVYAAPVAAQVQAVVNKQLTTETSDQDREDSERYRLLRRGQHWSVINGIGEALRAESLDAAIDAVRAAKEQS